MKLILKCTFAALLQVCFMLAPAVAGPISFTSSDFKVKPGGGGQVYWSITNSLYQISTFGMGTSSGSWPPTELTATYPDDEHPFGSWPTPGEAIIKKTYFSFVALSGLTTDVDSSVTHLIPWQTWELNEKGKSRLEGTKLDGHYHPEWRTWEREYWQLNPIAQGTQTLEVNVHIRAFHTPKLAVPSQTAPSDGTPTPIHGAIENHNDPEVYPMYLNAWMNSLDGSKFGLRTLLNEGSNVLDFGRVSLIGESGDVFNGTIAASVGDIVNTTLKTDYSVTLITEPSSVALSAIAMMFLFIIRTRV